ncbi:MAG: DUF2851 family protein, partial [Cyclobacteriaceae bacterium]
QIRANCFNCSFQSLYIVGLEGVAFFMQENFLHFIWEHQYFNKEDLVTTDGESLNVFHTGYRNDHSGPDFSSSRLSIGAMEWHRSTEIHIKASEWRSHQHHHDPGYNKVILHVVWQDDHSVFRQDGTSIPTLELKRRVAPEMIDRYQRLIRNRQSIPCSGQWDLAEEVVKLSMLDRALFNRIESKAKKIQALLEDTGNNWEEATYHWLVQNFGFKVNNDAFACLAGKLPYQILNRHRTDITSLESLLFGQAGFLDHNLEDEYHRRLAMEYQFLAHKYDLSAKRMDRHQWRFLRLRPANFPTVRLAQLAQLIHRQANIFSLFRDHDFREYTSAFCGNVSNYWRNHYYFGKQHGKNAMRMGRASAESLVINTAAPILVAYGKALDQPSYVEKAVQLLQSLKAEKNQIIRQWAALGLRCRSAFDSQAMIELYNSFCKSKRCLSCNVGAHLIKTA